MKSRKHGRPARWTSASMARAAILKAIKAHAPHVVEDLANTTSVAEWRSRWRLPAWCEEWAYEQLDLWADGVLPRGFATGAMVGCFTSQVADRSPFEIEGETIPVTVPEPTPDDPKRRERWLEHRRWLESRGHTVKPLRLTPAAVWRCMAWHPDRETRAAAHARLLEWAEQRINAYLEHVEAAAAGGESQEEEPPAGRLQDVQALDKHAEWLVRRRVPPCERLKAIAEEAKIDRRNVSRAIASLAGLAGWGVQSLEIDAP
jgi:hypothetical protein